MSKFLRRLAFVVGGLIILLVIAGAVMYFVGSSKINMVHQVASASLVLPTDSSAIAHGEHLTHIHGCRDCHGGDLSGQVFVDEPPFRVTASNLTPGRGGVGAIYSVADFDHAIRNGVRPDGRPLFVMPSAAYHQLSDSDASALIAYLKTVPPVDNELPATQIRFPGRILAAALIDPLAEVRTGRARADDPPEAGPTAEYGAYLASITCAHCHGQNLQGAQPPKPESIFAPNLAAAGKWSIEEFKHALRTGERPGGVPIRAEDMPYAATAMMKDYELEALHAYLGSLADLAEL